jgi:ribonuclease HI
MQGRLFKPNRGDEITAQEWCEITPIAYPETPNFCQNLTIYAKPDKKKQIYSIRVIEVMRVDMVNGLTYIHFKSAQARNNGKREAILDIMPCILILGDPTRMPKKANSADIFKPTMPDIENIQTSPTEAETHAKMPHLNIEPVNKPDNKQTDDGKPPRPTDGVCSDGSCQGGNNGDGYGRYKVTEVDGTHIFTSKYFQGANHNIMEFVGIVHAMSELKRVKVKTPIYTDSQTALAWVRNKRVKTKIEWSQKNALLKKVFDKCVKWLEGEDLDNYDLRKWHTQFWGEIPADFDNK